MNVISHNIENNITKDLENKMVFLSGPRQVGKTTLAKKIISGKKGLYLLYDESEDRKNILTKTFLHEKYVCLDEFHKYNRWKGFIKGVYDKYKDSLHVILTGSARLDVYQKSGDSLFGRYFLYHLHPLTLAELNSKIITLPEALCEPHSPLPGIDDLFAFGGFPEPFLRASEQEHRRWSNQRRQLLVQEELRELTHLQLLGVVENLMLLLPEKIGSVFSYSSLAEDLRVSTQTVQNWLAIFEKLYFVFKLKPYRPRITRSIQKRPKYYLWDWSQLENEGRKFENLVAGHLFKASSLWKDLGLANAELWYIQDRSGKEVDFLMTRDNKPWFLVEVKLAEEETSRNLKSFAERLDVPGIQVIKKPGVCRKSGNMLLVSADRWLGHFA